MQCVLVGFRNYLFSSKYYSTKPVFFEVVFWSSFISCLISALNFLMNQILICYHHSKLSEFATFAKELLASFILWRIDSLLSDDSVNSNRFWATAWQTHCYC
jgi:hypothetical protein